MSDTPARLLQLLSLLQTPRDWPGSELAERLQVSRRTIRRDVQRLRDLGYPVQATMGAVGGYRLVDVANATDERCRAAGRAARGPSAARLRRSS